jgi:hypothetical protein
VGSVGCSAAAPKYSGAWWIGLPATVGSGTQPTGVALDVRATGERDVPNANSQQYRRKAVEYERLVMENAGLPICEEFQRAHRSLIALAEKEEWLSRGTLGREPLWGDASPLPPLRARTIRNPSLEASTGSAESDPASAESWRADQTAPMLS